MFVLVDMEMHHLTFKSVRYWKDKPHLADFLSIIQQTSMMDFASSLVLGYTASVDPTEDNPTPPVVDFVGAYHETRNPAPPFKEFLERAYTDCHGQDNLTVWSWRETILTVMTFKGVYDDAPE